MMRSEQLRCMNACESQVLGSFIHSKFRANKNLFLVSLKFDIGIDSLFKSGGKWQFLGGRGEKFSSEKGWFSNYKTSLPNTKEQSKLHSVLGQNKGARGRSAESGKRVSSPGITSRNGASLQKPLLSPRRRHRIEKWQKPLESGGEEEGWSSVSTFESFRPRGGRRNIR